MREFVERARGIHARIAEDVPQIKRGLVWCHRCGAEKAVDGAECLRSGWPECCGATMSLDPQQGQGIAHARPRV